ncbi:MAG: hypothetical protein JMN27_11205 [gamma proteobacterium endosymbiont of Lamellibrachia anaximandri]|nr:hypothetical protein [gamma proteobacterium endosymbiont of Lamellibrachia anaximandri]MBL3534391.1 hypothetical protein [gamma proteobacterium endosymbiont of Lamellibrachia anaximandri]MBL3599558.1 hypothetical protein [gamma proteobacterium endosymbiont of Lamellibrachia anaximandri]
MWEIVERVEIILGLIALALSLIFWSRKKSVDWRNKKNRGYVELETTQAQTGLAVPDCFNDSYSSRMATSKSDMKVVLELRRASFSGKVIVPDRTYWACQRLNAYAMKVVFDFTGTPIGYWGVVPVAEETYHSFLDNKISHEEILTRDALGWRSIDRDNVYLYIIGIAVPPKGEKRSDEDHRNSGKVMGDLVAFVLFLLARLKVKGVFVYPSTQNGLRTLKHLKRSKRLNHFKSLSTGVNIGGNAKQPLYFVEEQNIERFRGELDGLLSTIKGLPIWDEQEKNRFLQLLEPI